LLHIFLLNFAAHSAVVLKAESMADKVEWVNKIKAVIQSKGGSFKSPNTEGGSIRQNHSDGSLVSPILYVVELHLKLSLAFLQHSTLLGVSSCLSMASISQVS
jgi:hypothetical protein